MALIFQIQIFFDCTLSLDGIIGKQSCRQGRPVGIPSVQEIGMPESVNNANRQSMDSIYQCHQNQLLYRQRNTLRILLAVEGHRYIDEIPALYHLPALVCCLEYTNTRMPDMTKTRLPLPKPL